MKKQRRVILNKLKENEERVIIIPIYSDEKNEDGYYEIIDYKNEYV